MREPCHDHSEKTFTTRTWTPEPRHPPAAPQVATELEWTCLGHAELNISPEISDSIAAMDHDGLFKKLLTTFFYEFLELFFYDLAARVDRSQDPEFLDKETYKESTRTRDLPFLSSTSSTKPKARRTFPPDSSATSPRSGTATTYRSTPLPSSPFLAKSSNPRAFL